MMSAVQPGQMLGPYRIIGQVGQGGMAAVYQAYHAAMDRYVAVKVVPYQFAHTPEFVERFRQEARTIARLEHPHILPVYDFGESDGIMYLVMRFLEAGTLKDRIAAGALPLTDIDRLLSQLVDALGYAHSRGVIHRDLKPSNVMIDARGDVFLTDFGIAKVVESSVNLTASGAITGTPAYMSPEQAQGEKLDARSDIYSLGIVLYEMVTGQVPYEAETPLAIILKHITEPLPLPTIVKPGVAPAIERVILKALAKNRDDRFSSCAELLVAWKHALSELQSAALPASAAASPDASTLPLPAESAVATGVESTPITPSSPVVEKARGGLPRWVLAGIGAIAVLALFVVGIFVAGMFAPRTASPAATTAPNSPTPVVTSAPPTTVPPTTVSAAVVPTLTSVPPTATAIPATPTVKSSPTPTEAPSPTPLPTSQPPAQRSPTPAPALPTGRIALSFAIPPYRNELDRNFTIKVADANGGSVTQLITTALMPAWSPDGKRIAYYSGGIYLANADGSGAKKIVDEPLAVLPAWSPNGNQIVYERVEPRPPSRSGGTGGGEWRCRSTMWGTCIVWVWVSTTGQSRAVSRPDSSIVVANADGTNRRQLAPGMHPTWSPDGGRIAYSSCVQTICGIYLIGANGGTPARLTNDVGTDPAWSGDGQEIIYRAGDGTGVNQIYGVKPDGSGKRQITNSTKGNNGAPVWSPDGAYIYYLTDQNGTAWAVYRMNRDGGNPVKLLNLDVNPELWENQTLSVTR